LLRTIVPLRRCKYTNAFLFCNKISLNFYHYICSNQQESFKSYNGSNKKLRSTKQGTFY